MVRMNRFSVQQVIHCDEDIFWKLFSAVHLTRGCTARPSSSPSSRSSRSVRTSARSCRKATGQPRVSALPDSTQKMLGANFRYVEESVFDKAAKTWCWTMTPNHLHDRLRNEGVLRSSKNGGQERKDQTIRTEETSRFI